MTEEEYKKYKEALLLFYGGGRFILNNRFLPGIPTLPDIQEYTITFTNLDYPDLPIDIPEPITDISGTVVILPTMSGEYEDTYNYYTPESWSIGSFGEEIELSDNLTANLIFNVVPKVVTYTVSFENTTYPDFDVSIPDSIIVPEGDSITLPSVSGEYEDEEYTYTPLKWSIGEFGEVITPDSNLTADLVWNVEPIQTYNIIGGLISETESIDWLSLDVLGNMNVDNVNLYSEITQLGTLSVDNIALTQDFYMLGKLMRDYDPAIEDATFIVYDTSTDNIVSFYHQELTLSEVECIILNSPELTLSEVECIILNSPELIIGVPQTVPNASFFFTENGRSEEENTVLSSDDLVSLYDEYGNLITEEETRSVYNNSIALSFMKVDGNMEQANNSDILVDNNDELDLQLSDLEQSSREITAWSVQCAKLFVLSFVNEQLPDVQIELPINEVGTYGTSITLPTIDGEYESGGKTWKPSAWDIGAFGSSYSLTADTVAHLVFEEVQQYQEITLYMQSRKKYVQTSVTSAFTGNVDRACCYQLYTDEQCTTPWTSYDYSNDYEVGYISSNDGQWYRYINSVSGLPDTTVGAGQPFKTAVILLDTGSLWLAANYSDSGAYAPFSKVVVRIYPKGQQHYAFYLGTANAYDNTSVSNGSIAGLKGKPGISSAQTVPWNVQDATLPTRTIQQLLGSAGNELNRTGIDWRDPSLGYKLYQITNSSGASISLRAVVFTLSTPTSYCYPNNINTDTPINSSTNYKMFDAEGDSIPYESAAVYRVIGMFKANGDATTGTWSNLNAMQLYRNASNNLCIKYTGSGTLTFYKVWYTKTPSATVSKEGNFGQYNWIFPPDVNTVVQPGGSCVLDDSGTPGTTYAYDSTKSYGVLQWQTVSGKRAGATELQIVGIEQGGQTIIGCKNVSSDPVTVSYVRVCVCSSSSATVVSVYDSSNVAYNAFKLSLSGIDYYYVLDNTQTAWVSDLSSIGYSLSPIST